MKLLIVYLFYETNVSFFFVCLLYIVIYQGANYVALPLYKWLQTGMMPRKEGGNRHLDATNSFLHQGPPWSTTYTCSDGEWMSVQCIEPQFYEQFLKGMGLSNAEGLPHQHDKESWPWMEARFASIFKTKTRDEWEKIFEGTDACTWPVLTASEAAMHPHNVARGSCKYFCLLLVVTVTLFKQEGY